MSRDVPGLQGLRADTAAQALVRLAIGAGARDGSMAHTARHPAPAPTPERIRRTTPILPPPLPGMPETGLQEDLAWLRDAGDGHIPDYVDVHFASDGRILEHEDGEDDLSLYIGVEHFWCVGHPSHRDFGHIYYRDVTMPVTAVQQDPNSTSLPVTLYMILACGLYRDAIRWLPHGRAFVVVDEERFFAGVCPTYFCTNQRENFLRGVQAYGFQMVGSPWLERGALAFCHEVSVRRAVLSIERWHIAIQLAMLTSCVAATTRRLPQRFLQCRWWLAYTMTPSRYYATSLGLRVADHALGAYLDMMPTLLPTLQPKASAERPAFVRCSSA